MHVPRVNSLVYLNCMSLLANLRDYRHMRSVAEQIPLYCVFGDTVLRSILQSRPKTQDELLKIRGFTPEKCSSYGEDILRIVSRARDDLPAPSRAVSHPPVRLASFSKGTVLRKPSVAAIKSYPGFSPCEQVYVLELEQGRVYVGRSKNVERRVSAHISGSGSAFTKAFPPTGVILPRLGRVSGSIEAAERDETLRYMFLRGIQVVRGWKYTRIDMSSEEVDEAEANIRELYDLCRRCGHPGHFMGKCVNTFDRLGRRCQI